MRRDTGGGQPVKTKWGVTEIWPESQVEAIPDHTKPAITDITCWRDQIEVPDLGPIENNEAAWDSFRKRVDAVDRTRKMTMAFMTTGVFEQLHAMIGFEDTLVNFLLEPDDMMDLCEAIGDPTSLFPHALKFVKDEIRRYNEEKFRII